MRRSINFIIFMLMVCPLRAQLDTVKLFNPNPAADEYGAAEMNMFKRCIVLIQPGYTLSFNDKQYNWSTLEKVAVFMKQKSEAIQKNKFYIITDSITAFNKIKKVIDLMVTNHITNYKVINYQAWFTPPAPVTIVMPGTTETVYVENDSAYFSIDISAPVLRVRLNGKEQSVRDTSELAKFIKVNKNDIKKVRVIEAKDTPVVVLKAVLEALKQNDIFTYTLVSKN